MAVGMRLWLLIALLFVANARSAELPSQQHADLIDQLESDDEKSRSEAEKRLIGLGPEAAEALLQAVCRIPSPSHSITDGILRILARWEQDSWTNPGSHKAIEKFVTLAHEPQYRVGNHSPLSSQFRIPIAERVRILDITPEESAAYLRKKKGIRIAESPGRKQHNELYFTSVSLTRDWTVEPRDFLYIANLSREIPGTLYVAGKRHPIAIDIVGPVSAEALVECFKFFRKSANSPFELAVMEGRINRQLLRTLSSYPALTGLLANVFADDITDEDWATCISAWPNVTNLLLSNTAGQKAIDAATKCQSLIVLKLKNARLTEDDLKPLRRRPQLQVLWVANGMTFIEYLNQKGTGLWQQGMDRKDQSVGASRSAR